MENNKFRITYNPYQKTIQYAYFERAKQAWEAPKASSPLSKSDYQRGTLQNKAEKIIRAILDTYCSDGMGVDLFFRGTAPDREDLKAVVRRLDPDEKIRCCECSGQLSTAQDVLLQINHIFEELAAEFEALPDPQIKEPIHKYLETTKPEVVLCVIGTYSAGKSTFINALIGEELLPSSVDPTTAKVFKLRSLAGKTLLDTQIRFQYQTQSIILRFNPEGYVIPDMNSLPDLDLKQRLDQTLSGVKMSPAYICKTLALLNDFHRITGKDVISDEIEIETPFYHSALPLEAFQFVIYDTPGSNAASHQEHLKVLESSLSTQTNGVPILLTQPDNMDSTDVEKLRSEIEAIHALDNSNILVVVNKADAKGETALRKIKESQSISAAQKNAENRVFFISAIAGLGAKKADMSQCEYQESWELFDDMERSFLNGRRRLFQYDILPAGRYEMICNRGAAVCGTGDDRLLLHHNSGLWAVENEIGLFAERHAAYNKCWQAQEYLSEALRRLAEVQVQKEREQAARKISLMEQMDEKKRELIEQLQERAKKRMERMTEDYINGQKSIYQETSISILNDIPAAVDKAWKHAKGTHKKADMALASMEDWAEKHVSMCNADCGKAIVAYAEKYWKSCVERYKNDCLCFIKESSSLTQEEKAFMEQYILAAPEIEISKGSFDFQHEATRPIKFLFWKLPGRKFDKTACSKAMREAISDDMSRDNQTYIRGTVKSVKGWTQRFITGLQQKVVTFNPRLNQLSQEIDRCEKELEQLQATQKKLRDDEEKIRRLFVFTDADQENREDRYER